jgi:hypothetical protein
VTQRKPFYQNVTQFLFVTCKGHNNTSVLTKNTKKKTQKNTLRTLQDKGQSDFCSCGSDSGGARVNYSGTFKAETNVDATG